MSLTDNLRALLARALGCAVPPTVGGGVPSPTETGSPSTESPSPTPTECERTGEPAIHGTGGSAGHFHGLAFWGCTQELLFGTHAGLWRTEAGATDLLPMATDGDFMGLQQDPTSDLRYWGSGHFHEDEGNSGFLESTDGGGTWAGVSLLGEVDFHYIGTSADRPDLVVGMHQRIIYVSENAGRTWTEFPGPLALGQTGLVVADPTGPVLLSSSSDGIERITLPAGTREPLTEDPVTALVRRGTGIAYSTELGDLFFCALDLSDCATAVVPDPSDPIVGLLFGPDLESTYVVGESSQVWHAHLDEVTVTGATSSRGLRSGATSLLAQRDRELVADPARRTPGPRGPGVISPRWASTSFVEPTETSEEGR